MDATYSAYVVAEHHTANNTDNNNDANGKYNHANYTIVASDYCVAASRCLMTPPMRNLCAKKKNALKWLCETYAPGLFLRNAMF